MRPQQKLGRQVGHDARTLGDVRGGSADPALQHAIMHRIGERHVVIGAGRRHRKLALPEVQVVEKGVLERILGHRDPIVVRRRRPYRHC
jgi:hypothetical protein